MVRRSARIRTPHELGLVLQQARLAQGMSQIELAAELETTQRSISEIENGKPTIYTRKLFNFIRASRVELTATIEVGDRDASDR